MAITINSNNSSLAVSQLGSGQKNLASSLEKIASGRRLNKAADNAVEITIADSPLSQARGTGQALRNANDAIKIADAALGQIDASRADIGSTQNQLTSTINNLATTGTIGDVDLAEEAINFTSMKVLTEAKSFALVQAKNMNKQNVLSLLQG